MKDKRILVSWRDKIVGSMITRIIERDNLGTICSVCTEGPQALRCIKEMRPNLIILDMFLPFLNGLSILKEIKSKNYKPLILGYCREMDKMMGVKAAHEGATGLIDYRLDYEEAAYCLERVCWGQKIYPDEVRELLDSNDYEKYVQKYTDVTSRQAQILEMSAHCYSNEEISKILHLSIKTIEKHKNAVTRKYGLTSVDLLVHFAILNGIIEEGGGEYVRRMQGTEERRGDQGSGSPGAAAEGGGSYHSPGNSQGGIKNLYGRRLL